MNILSGYSFMFYLWHSPILAILANNISIEDDFVKYLTVMLLGIIVTSYISFLMTKMNTSIIRLFDRA